MTRRWGTSRIGSQCNIAFERKGQRGVVSQWHGHRNGTGEFGGLIPSCVVFHDDSWKFIISMFGD